MDVIFTTRFGSLTVEPHDVLTFEKGLVGLEDCRHWVVLTDSKNHSLGWLQSLEQGHIALGVVSPRRFVPEYQVRVSRSDLMTLQLSTIRDAEVVVLASRRESGITLNLRGPLIINVENRQGCQVIAKDEYPVQYPLDMHNTKIRRIA
mgnify:CR=1 FL=1